MFHTQRNKFTHTHTLKAESHTLNATQVHTRRNITHSTPKHTQDGMPSNEVRIQPTIHNQNGPIAMCSFEHGNRKKNDRQRTHRSVAFLNFE